MLSLLFIMTAFGCSSENIATINNADESKVNNNRKEEKVNEDLLENEFTVEPTPYTYSLNEIKEMIYTNYSSFYKNYIACINEQRIEDVTNISNELAASIHEKYWNVNSGYTFEIQKIWIDEDSLEIAQDNNVYYANFDAGADLTYNENGIQTSFPKFHVRMQLIPEKKEWIILKSESDRYGIHTENHKVIDVTNKAEVKENKTKEEIIASSNESNNMKYVPYYVRQIGYGNTAIEKGSEKELLEIINDLIAHPDHGSKENIVREKYTNLQELYEDKCRYYRGDGDLYWYIYAFDMEGNIIGQHCLAKGADDYSSYDLWLEKYGS